MSTVCNLDHCISSDAFVAIKSQYVVYNVAVQIKNDLYRFGRRIGEACSSFCFPHDQGTYEEYKMPDRGSFWPFVAIALLCKRRQEIRYRERVRLIERSLVPLHLHEFYCFVKYVLWHCLDILDLHLVNNWTSSWGCRWVPYKPDWAPSVGGLVHCHLDQMT